MRIIHAQLQALSPAAILSVVLAACGPATLQISEDTAAIAVTPIVAPWVDALGEASPWRVAVGPSYVAAIHGGESGVVLIRRDDASTVQLFRPGAGPGEMRSPTSLWFDQDTLLVADIALARVLAFDTTGRHLASRPMRATGLQLFQGPPGWMLVPSDPATDAMARLIRAGTVDSGLLLGRRTADRVRFADDRVAYGGAGRIFVYESASGVISVVDTMDAELFPPAFLPDWLDAPLREAFTELATAMQRNGPPAVGDAALIKFLVGDGEGRVLLFYVARNRRDLGYAVRYDPAARRFTRFAFPSDSSIADVLWRASSAGIWGDVLVAVGAEAAAAVRMSGPP